MAIRYLDLADYLLIAEEVLGIEADVLAKMTALSLADSALNAPAAEFGGVEFYPEFAVKVAVLITRLAKDHALPDGNKRVALMCAIEFVERNGYGWIAPEADDPNGDETLETMKAIAAGTTDEELVARWIADRLRTIGERS